MHLWNTKKRQAKHLSTPKIGKWKLFFLPCTHAARRKKILHKHPDVSVELGNGNGNGRELGLARWEKMGMGCKFQMGMGMVWEWEWSPRNGRDLVRKICSRTSLPLTIAKLSTFKNGPVFGPPCKLRPLTSHQWYLYSVKNILFDAIIQQCNMWTRNLTDWFFGFTLKYQIHRLHFLYWKLKYTFNYVYMHKYRHCKRKKIKGCQNQSSNLQLILLIHAMSWESNYFDNVFYRLNVKILNTLEKVF